MMGIVLGFLLLFCFCILSMKFFSRKLKLKKADMVLMKLHKPISAIFLVICFLHIVLVLSVFKTRNPFVYVTGSIAVIFSILIILLCHFIKKDKKRRFLCHRLLSAALLLAIIGHVIIFNIDFQHYQTTVEGIHLDGIDISDLADGKYVGNFDAGYIYAQVEVEIAEGTISSIILITHENERGEIAEQVINDITKTNSFPVDAVSGATNSSKVIQKAVENALQ